MKNYPKISDLAYNCTELEYREHPAVSYSQLSRFFVFGPKSIISEEREDSDALKFGSLVDTLLTNEKELSNYLFIDSDLDISDKLKEITQVLFDQNKDRFEIEYISDDEIIKTADIFEYYTKWKPETRVEKIRKECSGYFKFLYSSKDKIVLPQSMLIDAQNCVNELKTNEWTREYFVKPQLNKSVELLFQQKFITDSGLKCMIDIIKIDHDKKTIELVDLKTTSGREDKFIDSFYKWNYYIQSNLYTHIVKETVLSKEEWNEYRLSPFKFICINKNSLSPIIWVDTKCFSVMNYVYKNEEYPIWRVLYDDYLWHLEHEIYKYPKDVVLNNGIMKLT